WRAGRRCCGARGESRTPTPFRAPGPRPGASAVSATLAATIRLHAARGSAQAGLDALEQANELLELGLGKDAHPLPLVAVDDQPDLGEDVQPVGGDLHDDAPAVVGVRRPAHEPAPFERVQ